MHRVAAGNFIVNITFGWEHAVAITDKNDAGKLVSHRFPQFSFAEGMVPEFFRYVIVDERFRHHLWLASPGGAGRNRVLKLDEMLNYLMRFPSRDEQIKIAEFFRHLDNLITLHQRECISFTGSAGRLILTANKKRTASSWEQRKVSELFRVTRGYVLAATQTETTKTDEKPYPVYSSQTKDKGLMGYYKDYLYEDAITWTTDGANAGTVNYRAGKFYCTNVCGVLLSNEVKANQMIAEALNSVAKGYVSYVGNPKLMNNVMADIVIQIPTQAEEREQLSSFFAKLDNLITPSSA